jgi:hypothetical protein
VSQIGEQGTSTAADLNNLVADTDAGELDDPGPEADLIQTQGSHPKRRDPGGGKLGAPCANITERIMRTKLQTNYTSPTGRTAGFRRH